MPGVVRREERGGVCREARRAGSTLASVWTAAWVAGLPLVSIVINPRLAHACAVCFSGRSDETRQAFIWTTAFMTFLPILVIGGVIWWLRRRWLAMEAEQRANTARIDMRSNVQAD